MWPGVAVHAERAGNLIGVWWVTRIPEAGDHYESLFPIWATERGHTSDLYFTGAILDGGLKILGIVVLASENDEIFQSAADEELPLAEESEISRSKV
jgi:hypothetical protein